MMDVRCLFGRHDYAQPKSPPAGTTDGTGVRLGCTRCGRTKVFHGGQPPSHYRAMPTTTALDLAGEPPWRNGP